MLIEDADDRFVIELRQRLRFRSAVGRHFQCDQPLHRPLPGEVDVSERSLAQFENQIEVVDRLARLHAAQGVLLVPASR